MTFDPLKALAPVAKAAEVPLVLFSNPAVPARTPRRRSQVNAGIWLILHRQRVGDSLGA
jgi:hypothetical protein